MGDPKKLRKKYSTPSHPWQKLRIDNEKGLMREYGFKNKKELWKLNSKLQTYKTQVKRLISKHDEASERMKQDLIKRLQGYNLLPENAILEDILALNMKDLCERRIQTIVFKKKLARSMKQSRQFITHEHIAVGEKKVTSPSYLVSQSEELMVRLAGDSPVNSEDHPERVLIEKEIKKEMAEAGLKPEEKEEKEKPKAEKKEEKATEPKEKPEEPKEEAKETKKADKKEEKKEEKKKDAEEKEKPKEDSEEVKEGSKENKSSGEVKKDG